MAIDLTFGLTTSLGYIEKLSFHAFMNHDSTNKYAWSNQMGNEVSKYLGESEENEYLYILKSHWQLCSIVFFVYVSPQPNRLTDANL